MSASRKRRQGKPTLLEWHRAIAARLPEDPGLLERARKRAAAQAENASRAWPGSPAEAHWRQWVDSLNRPLDEVADLIVLETPEWNRLRKETAFPVKGAQLRQVVGEQRRRANPERHARTQAETRLARLRVERGLSQEELAAAAGISVSAYWRLERNRVAQPLLSHVAACARVLGVSIEEVSEPEWMEPRQRPSG